MKRLIFSIVSLLVASSGAWAATFSAGGGAGTSIVDANGTGDYTSLASAAADFTGYAGGATGNWNLLIRSDLEETTTSLFGNDTNGHTITVRPAPGTSVTVSFLISQRPSASNEWASWDGNIVIGPNKLYGNTDDLLVPDSIRYMDTDNFIIDGCNAPGGTERNLTILTPESADVGPKIPRHAIRIVGGADDTIVRNCTIDSRVTGSASDAYICVLVNSRFVSGGSVFYLPHGTRIENCGLIAQKGNTGRGVYAMHTGPTSTGLDAIREMVVTNNDISVSHRAVQYGSNAGGEISYNRIQVSQEIAGQRPEVIIHTGSNGVTFPFVSDIVGNHVSQVVTPSTNGFNYVIGVGGVIATNLDAVFNIRNNMIGGVNGTAIITTSNGILGRAIAFESNSKTATVNIQHNSFSLADIPNYGETIDDSSNRMAVLSLLNSNGFAGTINFENNIVSYRQHNASIISAAANPSEANKIGGTLNFNNNTYHLGTGTKFAEMNGTVYNTLADWQAAGHDLSSNIADPFMPASGGAWISDSDQHFTAEPAAEFKTAAAIPAIMTDIDMDSRPATVTKGADEFATSSAVDYWMLY